MRVGLIIVFNAFDGEALKDNFISAINALSEVKMCLVCNNSSEQVFETLTEIAEVCCNAHVVNTKRKKSDISSVRAGARFMHNQYNLKYLGFIVGLNDAQILEELKAYISNQQTILALNQREQGKKAVKQTFFQRLFSVTEFLEKIAPNSMI